jgi:hypothetical protein
VTRKHIEALRRAWQAHGAAPCPHAHVDLESSESGYFTGRYVCKTCGAEVPMDVSSAPQLGSERRRLARPLLYTSLGMFAAALPFITVWYQRRRLRRRTK